jgi:hypothetical protein
MPYIAITLPRRLSEASLNRLLSRSRIVIFARVNRDCSIEKGLPVLHTFEIELHLPLLLFSLILLAQSKIQPRVAKKVGFTN